MGYKSITQYTSKNYTPASQVAAVFGQPRRVKSITIHHWGLMGQKFENVVNFLCTNNTPTSAHYVIEDGRSACIVDPDDAAWHSGNPAGNATSIGLELRPEATDGDYETAAEVIRELRAQYGNVPLVPHKHWHNTACPGKWDLNRLDRLARSGTLIQAASNNVTKEDTLSAAEVNELKKYIDKKFSEAPRDVWGYKNDKVDKKDAFGILRDNPRRTWAYKNDKVTPSQAYSHLVYGTSRLDRIIAQNAALEAAVSALAESKGVDPAAVERAVNDAVARALSDVSITLTNATVEEEAK